MLEVSQEDKTQALLCWILGIFIGILSPIIFMLVAKGKPFVYWHAMQSLMVHLVGLVLWVIAAILAVVTCGIGAVLFLVPWAYVLIISIMAAIEANNGRTYMPPVTGELARKWFKLELPS